MDKLSNELPDELILKIFSLLPMYKETVATNLIAKASEYPWKLESDVKFDDDDESDESFVNFMSFVYGSLLSNNTQLLERFNLKLRRNYSASDINFFVKIAVSRYVRKLRIHLFGKFLELPSCLSTCITLKSLVLRDLIIEMVPPLYSLPSLKSLHLFSVKFPGKKSVASLLRSCPELEYLIISQRKDDDLMIFDIDVFSMPSLKSLELFLVNFSSKEFARLLKSCPRLEYLVLNQAKDGNMMTFNPDVLTTWPSVISMIINVYTFSLPSLKSLKLFSVKFSSKEFARLLKSCPKLEYLVIDQKKGGNMMIFNVEEFSLPSLKSLHLLSVKFSDEKTVTSLLKSCPKLEYLVIDQTKNDNVIIFHVEDFTLPSTKSLHLLSVKFSGEKSVESLLNSFPELEYLVIN